MKKALHTYVKMRYGGLHSSVIENSLFIDHTYVKKYLLTKSIVGNWG